MPAQLLRIMKYAYGGVQSRARTVDRNLRTWDYALTRDRRVKTRIVRDIIAFDTDANAKPRAQRRNVITADAEKGDHGCVFGVHIHTRRVLSFPHKCQIKSCYTFNALPGFACIIQKLIPVE